MNKSIYSLTLSTISNVRLDMITNETGLYAPYSVSLAANKLFFMGDRAIYALNSLVVANSSINLVLLSKPIDGLYTTIDAVYPKDAIGYTRNANYHLFTPNVIVGSNIDDRGLEYPVIGNRH